MKLIDIAILTNIQGLGSVNIIKIINFTKANNINNLYELANIKLSKIVNIKLANNIEAYLNTDIYNLYKNMQSIIDTYIENGISCLSIVDNQYPSILKESTNPPVMLYYKGNINLLNTKCAAVIGTRNNTILGEKITTKTVEFLVKNDFTVVSGLAKGIDEIGHRSTLNNNGKTIAILPLIDKIYPASNKQLAQEILDTNGLLISEVKPNTSFHSSQLVKRDRIQSGLSKAIFVIETSLHGGSMHATKDALKLNRPVFTPDIYQLGDYYQNYEQIQGIKYLIDEKKSIAYTSHDYQFIKQKLLQTMLKQGTLL